MTALDDVVSGASLADADALPRRSFTASARAGVLAMRRASAPWRFAATLLRAGLAVAPELVARARVSVVDGQRILRLDLRFDVDDWDWADLASLLEASLQADASDPGPLRWRSLVGSAINGALGTEPRWVELHTPAGGRRWAFDAGAAGDQDPYALQRITSEVESGGMSVRLAHPAEGVAAIWARWTGRHGPEAEVARLWSWALGRPVDEDQLSEGVEAARLDPHGARELGEAGRWWPADDGGLFLRRDGVRVADLTTLVERLGGSPQHGELEAARVSLDADERKPIEDSALHEVIAWMQSSPQDAVATLLDGSGRSIDVEDLRASDEIAFAWPHQLVSARAQTPTPVNGMWPEQLAWLRERTEATFVPAEVLLETGNLQRVDLTALREGSVGPVGLGEADGGRVEAYVHRYPVASRGHVEVHGFSRALFRGPAPDLPGVTVIGVLPSVGASLARAEDYADVVRERAVSCSDMLTQAILEAVPDDATRARVPWFAHRWTELGALDLGLRYSAHGDGVRLTWREEPLLSTTVAFEGENTPRTALHALQRLRDAGGIVVAEATGHWHTLESAVPAWAPWRLSTRGEELLRRLVGEAALWRMPMVPEAQLRPASIRSQSHVRLSSARVAELRDGLRALGRSAEWARRALVAHALWARATGEDSDGLEASSLLLAYDPQAAQPWRRVSIADVAAGGFGGVVPPGAEHRGLARPVIQATPAVAHALVELGLVSAGTVRTQPRAPRSQPARSAAPTRAVWLRQRVIDPKAIGALTIADVPAGVEVWEDGLRTRTVTLPRPYDAVSGRVWLQQPWPSDAALGRLLLGAAGLLEASARRALLLSAPGSARARGLRAFVEGFPEQPASSPEPVRVAKVLGSDRLAATLRFALGRAVTVEVSRVSWSLVRDDEGLETVRLGALHPLVRAARDDDAKPSAIGAAALAALFELYRDGRVSQPAFDEGIARVLAALE